jgi:EmrB/QacA subfamily drug resistance transporter
VGGARPPTSPADVATAQRVALLVSIVGAFMSPFVGSSINVALPPIGEEFALDAVLLGWVPTAYLLTASICLVPMGRLADIYGRKRVFTLGVVVNVVCALLAAFAPNGMLLILWRGLQGMGGAMMSGTAPAILASVFPPESRGKVLGWTVTAVYAGLSAGPFLGGLLTEYWGWRGLFLAVVPPGVVMFVLLRWGLPGEWAEARGQRFDALGTAIYAVALAALTYSLSRVPTPLGLAGVAIGLVALGLFVAWELRSPSPVLDVRLLRDNAAFALANLAALTNYAATFAATFLLSLYLQYLRGMTPREAGLILVAQPIVMALCSAPAGRLSDRIEPRLLTSVGMALTALGLFAFTLLDTDTPLAFVIVAQMVLGLGFALFSSPNMNAAMSAVPRGYLGMASGLIGTMRGSGQMLSMALAMLVLALYVGHVEITPAQHAPLLVALRVTFLISALICCVGTGATLARVNLRRAH